MLSDFMVYCEFSELMKSIDNWEVDDYYIDDLFYFFLFITLHDLKNSY